MTAYEKGLRDGKAQSRKDRYRTYQTDKAEKDYWRGYLDGIASIFPGRMIVQCEREGRIFAVLEKDPESIDCPTCGRGYFKEGDDYVSDRKLTILKP